MKERITTSISLLAEYWKERVEPLLQKGLSVVGIFRDGVEYNHTKKNEKEVDNEETKV